jgi:hypothetical protein
VRLLALVLLMSYAAGSVCGSVPALADATQYSVADQMAGLWGFVPIDGRESRNSVEFAPGGTCLLMSEGQVLLEAAWRVRGDLLMVDVPGARRGDFTYAVIPARPDRLLLFHVGTGTKFVLTKK